MGFFDRFFGDVDHAVDDLIDSVEDEIGDAADEIEDAVAPLLDDVHAFVESAPEEIAELLGAVELYLEFYLEGDGPDRIADDVEDLFEDAVAGLEDVDVEDELADLADAVQDGVGDLVEAFAQEDALV